MVSRQAISFLIHTKYLAQNTVHTLAGHLCCFFLCRRYILIQNLLGPNPTTSIYNASVVKNYNANSSLVRLKTKILSLCFEKRTSKFKSRRIGSSFVCLHIWGSLVFCLIGLHKNILFLMYGMYNCELPRNTWKCWFSVCWTLISNPCYESVVLQSCFFPDRPKILAKNGEKNCQKLW
jgi:hypothetical protein